MHDEASWVNNGFDSAVQKIATEKNGGEVTKQLFWDIVVALSKDIKRADEEGEKRHAETFKLLEAHVKWDEERSAELAKNLAQREREQAKICAEEHEALMKRLHAAPNRSTDPPGSDYTGERDEEMGDIRRAWRFIRWFVAAAILLGIDVAARFLADAIDKVP